MSCRHRYYTLDEHLAAAARKREVVLSFGELEELVGEPLPGAWSREFTGVASSLRAYAWSRGCHASIDRGRGLVTFVPLALRSRRPDYARLFEYLEAQPQGASGVRLDFATVEQLIGAPLPATASLATFWHSLAVRGTLHGFAWLARVDPRRRQVWLGRRQAAHRAA